MLGPAQSGSANQTQPGQAPRLQTLTFYSPTGVHPGTQIPMGVLETELTWSSGSRVKKESEIIFSQEGESICTVSLITTLNKLPA